MLTENFFGGEGGGGEGMQKVILHIVLVLNPLHPNCNKHVISHYIVTT